MIVEAITGLIIGPVARLLPEVVGLFKQRSEQNHELKMLEIQERLDRLKFDQEVQLAETRGKIDVSLADIQLDVAETKALASAAVSQMRKTGIGWVDAINSLVRPIVTFWWVIILYTCALAAEFAIAFQLKDSLPQALLEIWGPDERAIVATLIGFWFVDRAIRKNMGR